MENVTNGTEEYINKTTNFDITLIIITSSLSVMGACLLFIFTFLRWRSGEYINEPKRLLLCLTISDLFVALGNIFGAIRFIGSMDYKSVNSIVACHTGRDPLCIFQAFVTIMSSMSSFFWTTIIAFHLLYLTPMEPINNGPTVRIYKRTIFYHCISWGIPAALSITALSKNLLGSDLTVGSGAWCWISACLSQTERTIWMTLTMKGWEILMYVLCALFYILLKWSHCKEYRKSKKVEMMTAGINAPRFIRLQRVPDSERKYTKVDKRFMYLWLIELFLRSFGTVRFVMATIKRHTGHAYTSYDKADTILFHFQNFGDSAQALCSFVVFCAFSARTRELVRLKCFRGDKRDDERLSLLSNASYRND
ncbi:Hypothetical predicted protein [Mytilus galloprovincialis]|uniref:G-protein coupled receptors family 2 profile 2 domain-containing protein n=1 Tax=Mytilus galloprovincialis TaxID=29158 RepID=A0A8B6GEB3_MYTGA|nr:Hypothetical predicted protein [Mytilus galloprovincialis]